MREILFRGKRVDNGEWVEGNNIIFVEKNSRAFIIPPGKYKGSCQTKRGLFFISPKIEVIPETIGQYIGLSLKKGPKIFEGDIIEYGYIFQNNRGVVVFNNFSASFQIDSNIKKTPMPLPLDDFHLICNVKIIGNIHDNPELLGG